MKEIIIILFYSLFALHCLLGQQYSWVNIGQNLPGDYLYHDLSDLYFINDNEGWITSSSHDQIYHTSDGGTTFTIQSIASKIMTMHMLGANEGYAASNDGSIYRTTNGGTNWNFFAPTFATLNDITFPRTGSTATGYASGDNGAIFSVTFSGATQMTCGVVSDLESITFPSDTQGWVCGQAVILHFFNDNWQGGQRYPSGSFNAIYFTDNQNGWAVGDNGIIIHTTDGQNWNAQTNPDPQSRSLYSVFFLNPNKGWAVGFNGIILHTTNGGTNWNVEGSGLTTAFLRGVHFTSSTNGYVIGNNKTLLKYTPISDINQTEQTSVIHIYPNPTARIIKLDIPGNQQLESVVISDMTGRKVIQKTNLFTNEIDLQSLPGGFYSVQIVTDKQKYFGKINKQ